MTRWQQRIKALRAQIGDSHINRAQLLHRLQEYQQAFITLHLHTGHQTDEQARILTDLNSMLREASPPSDQSGRISPKDIMATDTDIADARRPSPGQPVKASIFVHSQTADKGSISANRLNQRLNAAAEQAKMVEATSPSFTSSH